MLEFKKHSCNLLKSWIKMLEFKKHSCNLLKFDYESYLIHTILQLI